MCNSFCYGYRKVHVQDGAKTRPRLELNPPADAIVRRIFDRALEGQSVLDITRMLNSDGIPTTNGKQWLKTTVHRLLTNESYTGTFVWDLNAKDGGPPIRVEHAFPAIVNQREFERVGTMMQSRAPNRANPRRIARPLPALRPGQLRVVRQGANRG